MIPNDDWKGEMMTSETTLAQDVARIRVMVARTNTRLWRTQGGAVERILETCRQPVKWRLSDETIERLQRERDSRASTVTVTV